MEDPSNYRVPEGFNPYVSADAARGLIDAVHHFLFEGPGTARLIPPAERAGLNALVELLQTEIHCLQDYLREIENRTTLDLPLTDAAFDAIDVRFRHADGVKEPSPAYLVR